MAKRNRPHDSAHWRLTIPAESGSPAAMAAVVAGVVAVVLVAARVGWEVTAPLDFEVSKAAIYVRDVVTLVPAAALGAIAVIMSPGRALVLPSSRTVSFLAAASATIVCAVLARFGLLGIPHIADEAAYLWQADLLANGRLWAEPWGGSDTLIQYVDDVGGRRISAFFIGSSLPLAIGHALGVPWLVDPLLAGLLVLVTAWAARRLFDLGTGSLAAALLASSPFLLFQGASYFSHVWTALLTVPAFTLAVAPRRRWDPLAAGALSGAALLSRPVSAVVLVLVIAAYWAITTGWRRTLVSAGWAVMGATPFMGIFLWVNRQVAGDWLTTAHRLLLPDESIAVGAQSVANAAMNFVGVAVDLAGLTVVATVLVLLGVRTKRPAAVAVAGYAMLQLGAYSLYPYHGISYGPRFVFEVAPLLVALAALGIRSVPALQRRSLGLVGVAVVVTAIGFLPTRLMMFHQRAEYLELPTVESGSLVLVTPGSHQYPDAFYPAFVRNGHDPASAEVLFLRDQPERRCAVVDEHPDRIVRVWEVDERRLSRPLDADTCDESTP